jgi:hypothetical protein
VIIHVLVKRYLDNSAFSIIGATGEDAIAIAFCVGGEDGAAHAESYAVDTDAALHWPPSKVEPTKWE